MGPDKDDLDWNASQDWRIPGKSSHFDYSDSTEQNIHKEGKWPELDDQENPEKE